MLIVVRHSDGLQIGEQLKESRVDALDASRDGKSGNIGSACAGLEIFMRIGVLGRLVTVALLGALGACLI